jgi:hypothetical protein
MYIVLLQRMRDAVEHEDPDAAISCVREIGGQPISFLDLLDLVRLLARKGDPRFDAWATRWLTRFVVEQRANLVQWQITTAAMGALAVEPDNQDLVAALRGNLPKQS